MRFIKLSSNAFRETTPLLYYSGKGKGYHSPQDWKSNSLGEFHERISGKEEFFFQRR